MIYKHFVSNIKNTANLLCCKIIGFLLLQRLAILQNKRSRICCCESSDCLLDSLLAGSKTPINITGHPRRALRNCLSGKSGRKSVSHRHKAAEVGAALFRETFPRTKISPCFVITRLQPFTVAERSAGLQLTPLPGVCELGPSCMNYGSEKYSWTRFFKH